VIKQIVQRLDLTPGTLYDYAPICRYKNPDGSYSVGRVPFGRYKVIGMAKVGHTGQCQITYLGIGGSDDGKRFTATPWDFATKFVPVPVEICGPPQPQSEPDPPMPFKEYDMTGRESEDSRTRRKVGGK